MATDPNKLAEMAAVLEQSPDYRVLRRLVPRTEFSHSNGQLTRIGLLLDVETTGLDTVKDEVIELGMVKFAYLPDGKITKIIDVFASFNEPAAAIPPDTIELTGITDAVVAGCRIEEAAVATFASDCGRRDPRTMRISIVSSPSDTGRSSSTEPGPVRRPKLNGESTVLTALGWDICWQASAISFKLIAPSTIAWPWRKSWLRNCRAPIFPPSVRSSNVRGANQSGSGPSNPPSI